MLFKTVTDLTALNNFCCKYISASLFKSKLTAIIRATNVRGENTMNSQLPFNLINGQIILHDGSQGVDKIILNSEGVAAIKWLIQKCSDKENGQTN